MAIPAVLLAAGASRRMGAPKQLLPCPPSGEPLVRRTARVLREAGAIPVYVVVAPGFDGDGVAAAVSDLPGVVVVVNPEPERGMLSSVQAGLRAAVAADPSFPFFLVTPCDLPRLEPGAIEIVIRVAMNTNAQVVAPAFAGKRGHPTAFRTELADEILGMAPETYGLNEVLKRHADAVAEVAVADEGATRDADTPAEWRDLTGDEAPGGGTSDAMNCEPEEGADGIPPEAWAALDRQDAALRALDELRTREPMPRYRAARGGGRRDFRRWPLPEGVTTELHDGRAWRWIRCQNVAVGGACVVLPAWAGEGPVPARLGAPNMDSVLVLAEVMWRDAAAGTAGIRFDFKDEEEREVWTGALIDALLAAHALK